MIGGLTPAEQMAIRYQEIIKRYQEGCGCGTCSLVELYLRQDRDDEGSVERNPWDELG